MTFTTDNSSAPQAGVNYYTNLYLDILRGRGIGEVVFESGVLLLINLLSVVGNVLTCAVIYTNPSLRTLTNLFIVVLALSDIIMSVLCVPFSVTVLMLGDWVFNVHVCRMQCFLVYFLALGSLQTMTMIAINRYYRVLKPTKYRTIFTFRSTRCMLLAVWMCTAVLLAIPFAVKAVLPQFNPAKAACVMFRNKNKSNSAEILAVNMVLVIVSTVISTVIISFCYLRVFRVVGNHFIRVQPTLGLNHSLNSSIREVKSTRTLFFILLAFAICWLPVFTIEVLQTFVVHWWQLPRSCHLLWTFCGCLSSAVNPLVFGTTSRIFRRRIVALVYFWGAKDNTAEVSNTVGRKSTFVISGISVKTARQESEQRWCEG